MSRPGAPSTSGTDPWRVRFGGQVYRVKDEASLRRLVDGGRVPPDATVQPPGWTDWLSLDDALGRPSPPPATPDPWSAWESLDDEPLQPTPAPGAAAPADDVRVEIPPPAAPASHGPPGAPADTAPPVPEPASAAVRPASSIDGAEVEERGLRVSGEGDHAAASDEAAGQDLGGPVVLGEPLDVAPAHVPARVRPPTEGPASDPARPAGATPTVGARAGARRDGNVIYFPGPRPGRRATDGATALDPVPPVEPLPFPDPPVHVGVEASELLAGSRRGRAGREDARPRTNWWRVGGIAVVGTLILLSVRFYVAMNTGIDYGPPQARPAVPPGAEIYLEGDAGSSGSVARTVDAALETADPAVRSTAAVDLHDPYKDMEVDLRSHMMPGLQPVESVDDLETALFMELTNVGLDKARVAVNLLATAGDSDIPEVVEIRVQVRDNGEGLDRQIAAASLVIGKYEQHLGLTVPLFELGFEGITEGKIRKRRIDADQARQLFLARLRLRDFLAGLQR